MKNKLLWILVATALAGGLYYFFQCPCDRIPGGWLLGEEISEPVDDWSFANDVGLCQLQVSAVLPHSITLNCMASNKNLYLSCASCQGKYWSTAALADPQARIRIGELVYPVNVERVTDAATLDEAWIARSAKTGREPGSPRAEGWWSFQVSSR